MKSRYFAAVLAVSIAGCQSSSAGGSTPPLVTPTGPPPVRATTLFVSAAEIPGRILTVKAQAHGTVTPLTQIYGTKPGLGNNFFAFADAFGHIWATNCVSLSTSGPQAFEQGATGNVKPVLSIVGPNTGLSGCQNGIAVDGEGNVYVADDGSTAAYPGGQVAAWPAGVTGNVAPALRIAGPNAAFHSPTGLALDSSLNIYVADSCLGFGNCLPDVQVFPPASTGNIASASKIAGAATGLSTPEGLAFDGTGNLYVANSGNNSIAVFAPAADGNVAPIRRIAGPKTKLELPVGIAVDAAGYLYVGNQVTSSTSVVNYPVLVFAPKASGNVAPVQEITIDADRMSEPAGIAVK